MTDVAFAQLLRLLDRQATVLAELRTRASIVLSAIGIVSALMGTESLTGGHPHALGTGAVILALASLMVGVRFCVTVLWPVGRGEPSPRLSWAAGLFKPKSERGEVWKVALAPEDLPAIRSLDDEVAARARIYDVLAPCVARNYAIIDLRTEAFNLACLTLLAQVVGWGLALLLR